MTKVFLSLLLIVLFNGCFNKNTLTEDDCIEKGMVLEKNTVLNYRTGKYEDRYICVKK